MEFENLITESGGHLEQGRYRMALKAAEQAYEINPDDERVLCCLAKAKLENGSAEEALSLADIAVSMSAENIDSHFCRAWILYRLGIFESALSDINFVLAKNKSFNPAYVIKARILAASERYKEASENIEAAVKSGLSGEAEYIKGLIASAAGYSQKIFSRTASRKDILLENGSDALKKKEFWFSLWASREILKDRKYISHHRNARLLELESLVHMFRFKEAFETADRVRNEFEHDNEFDLLYRKIMKKYPEGEQRINAQKAGNTEIFENPYFTVTGIHCFDYLRSLKREKREYLVQFDGTEIRYVGVEVTIENPFFGNRDIEIEGTAVWFLNEIETGRHKFNIRLKKEWKVVEFVQSWGTEEPGFWKKGTGKILILLDDNAVCAKYFDIKDFELAEKQKTARAVPPSPEAEVESGTDENSGEGKEESLEELLNDLNRLTGLTSVKQSLWDFVTYLKFLNERRKHGLKTTGEFSVHCVFTGNPGTGKTTVARKLGKIFKAMGILKNGHVVEVDRASLVGQYIGETAQKTEKVINEASGGILFIDEAYTLSRPGAGQDFGQEAIDILLKRMEDRKDDFVVIAAGYPARMKDFINSNPGLKSRFTHFFHFDDFTPDELVAIFRQFASEEDFIITEDSVAILKKEFVHLYRKRDESFGNARVALKYLNGIKLNVSRRLAEENIELSKEAFTLIVKEDVENLFSDPGNKKFIFGIDEDKLEILLEKLDSLTGLGNVKKEINEIVKLTRYYIDNGEDPQKNISGHLVFLGNPGTGKTTVARLFSEIYSALGILPRGHLVEVDRQALVGQYVGQTAIKTRDVIDSAIGGTLFIDEAYSLLKENESDFGRESIDTLIKRMEDDKGKFILIAAGYTEETNKFLDMNPGLSSRFYKKIYFDDYSPEELYAIALSFLEDKKLRPDNDAALLLKKALNDAYLQRDKRFGNARFVRNIADRIIRNHLLYVAGLSRASRSAENSTAINSRVITEACETILWNKGIESDPEQLLMELNRLAGLNEVKKLFTKQVSSLKVADMREKRGLKSMPRQLHSVFYGSPGTGKSTAAAVFANVYKNLGILSEGHIVFANKLNMSSIYVGQSKTKTSGLIQKAAGGILYIEDTDFIFSDAGEGSEIIDAFVEELSKNEGNIIFIMSAHNKEGADLVKKNQQLCKYFTNYYFFEDYDPRELVEIAYGIAESNSYRLDEGALQLLMDLFNELAAENPTAGNASLVKEIIYKAISAQEERLFQSDSPSDEELITLVIDDVKKAAVDYIKI